MKDLGKYVDKVIEKAKADYIAEHSETEWENLTKDEKFDLACKAKSEIENTSPGV